MTSKENFLSFKQAQKYVWKLKLKTRKDWFYYSQGKLKNKEKKPSNIPSNPDVFYQNKGWKSWTNWFGSNQYKNFFKIKSNLKKDP